MAFSISLWNNLINIIILINIMKDKLLVEKDDE